MVARDVVSAVISIRDTEPSRAFPSTNSRLTSAGIADVDDDVNPSVGFG